MALSCRILHLCNVKEELFQWNTLAGNGFSKLLETFIHGRNFIQNSNQNQLQMALFMSLIFKLLILI